MRFSRKQILGLLILFLPFGAFLFLDRAKGIAANRSVLAPALLGMLFSVVIETTRQHRIAISDECLNGLNLTIKYPSW